MKPNLDDLDRLIEKAKILRSAQVDLQKKSIKARDAVCSSPKRMQALSSDATFAAMHVERCWDSLHAAAVDLGVADAMPVEHYKQRVLHLSGFHDHAYQPEMPRTIKDSLKVGDGT